MSTRDNKGNTEEEVYDLFFDWLDDQVSLPQLFSELPELSYSELISFYYPEDEESSGYSDLLFDLWKERIYNKNK